MLRSWYIALAGFPCLAVAADVPGMPPPAASMTLKMETGGYRIELHFLPPAAFVSGNAATGKHASSGVLIVGGAAPLPMNAKPAPDHDLNVQVFDRLNGAPVTDAKVLLSFVHVDAAGKPTGRRKQVPVVIMEADAAGAASTQYGNNVVMPPGAYSITVTINGATASTTLKYGVISRSDSP